MLAERYGWRVEDKPKVPVFSEDDTVTKAVPQGLRISAALSWRFLLVIAALYVIMLMVGYLSVVVIPLAIALLLGALLVPAVNRLVRLRLPRGLATVVVLIGGLGAVGGLLAFVIVQFTAGLPALQQRLNESLTQVQDWLINGPLHLRETQIEEFINNAVSLIQENQASITASALTTAGAVGEFLTGFLLTLFILIFFLINGEQIWAYLMRGVPSQVRERVDRAGQVSFTSLVSYVRATAAVAVVDAVGIGIGLWIVSVPLVVPLATLVFLGAFVPIIGAVLTGAVAVLVALVTNGFVTALIVLAIVVGVMQLESHVLQPILLGRAVRLHPLAVILAITAGLVSAGIPGALLSVPLLAVLNAGIKSLVRDNRAKREAETGQPETEQPEAEQPEAEQPEAGAPDEGPSAEDRPDESETGESKPAQA